MAKSRAQLEAENASLRASQLAAGWTTIGVNLIFWGAVVLICRYATIAIQAFAGKETLANVAFNVGGTVEVSVTLAWIVGVAGVVYGRRERRLRRDAVERLHGRIAELEAQIDPGRSSSRLTPRGDTRPEDRR